MENPEKHAGAGLQRSTLPSWERGKLYLHLEGGREEGGWEAGRAFRKHHVCSLTDLGASAIWDLEIVWDLGAQSVSYGGLGEDGGQAGAGS